MPFSPAQAAAGDLLKQLETVLLDAEKKTQTAEIDPHRGRLFELFVLADALGGLADDADPDLSAEALGRHLAESWNMAELGGAVLQPGRLAPQQQARLRTLMAFIRLWSEWTYAWRRWPEFHASKAPNEPAADDEWDEGDDDEFDDSEV